MDDGAFAELVAAKLGSRPPLEEALFFGRFAGLPGPGPRPSFAEHMAAAALRVDRQHAQRTHELTHPPAPHLSTLKSWQHGFTAAASRDEVDGARNDALFLHAQAFGCDRRSASSWRRCLDCFDRPGSWLALAAELESEGEVVQANAALAGARWLDDQGTRDAIASHVGRRGTLPRRVAQQPDPAFRSLPLAKRHWRAWDMKNYALVDVPSLLAFESDESFSVRTRVYRSLGQTPHPAAIQALREGTLDPHPFARAQAVRSLGRCADPMATPLLTWIARTDTDPEVVRAADKARQRIVGYWTYFGEWSARLEEPLALVRALIEQGLPRLALDVLSATDAGLTPAGEDLYDELEYLDPNPRSTMSGPLAYHHWFKDAAREEESWRAVDTGSVALARVLAEDGEGARLTAMLAISGNGIAPPPIVAQLTSRMDAIGWAARRVMRCGGTGTMNERRIVRGDVPGFSASPSAPSDGS